MQLNQTYKQEECFNLCIQQTVIDKCKCYDLNYQNLSTNVRPCRTLDDFDCLEDQWQMFDVDKCIESSCPLECNSVEYKLSLSTLEFPSVNFYKNFFSSPYANDHASFFNKTNPPTYEFFKANSLGFQVYFQSLDFTQITESPKMNVYDLFTQIGGALGLFVSFSVFTLFEVMELVILIVHGLLIGRRSKVNAWRNFFPQYPVPHSSTVKICQFKWSNTPSNKKHIYIPSSSNNS